MKRHVGFSRPLKETMRSPGLRPATCAELSGSTKPTTGDGEAGMP
jgi:hypothetical protein